MDLHFAPEDTAFREEVRAFMREKLPRDVAHKVEAGFELGRDEILHWHRTLHAQGWIAPSWPKEWGGTGWSTTQKYVYDEESALAGAPRLISFGIIMCG